MNERPFQDLDVFLLGWPALGLMPTQVLPAPSLSLSLGHWLLSLPQATLKSPKAPWELPPPRLGLPTLSQRLLGWAQPQWLQVEFKGRQPGLVQKHLHSTFQRAQVDLSSQDSSEQRHQPPLDTLLLFSPLIFLPHSLSYLKPQIQPGRADRAVGCRVTEQMRTLELRDPQQGPRLP